MRDTTQTCTAADQVRHEQRGAVVQSRAQQDVSHMLLICPFSARRFLPLESEAGFVSGGYHVSVYTPPHLSCSTLWLIISPYGPFGLQRFFISFAFSQFTAGLLQVLFPVLDSGSVTQLLANSPVTLLSLVAL